MSNLEGGVCNGAPSFVDFLDQLASMRDTAAAGSDLVHSVLETCALLAEGWIICIFASEIRRYTLERGEEW